MFALHKQRYPYNHNEDYIRSNFLNFQIADDDFIPICLKGKHWNTNHYIIKIIQNLLQQLPTSDSPCTIK